MKKIQIECHKHTDCGKLAENIVVKGSPAFSPYLTISSGSANSL